MDRGSDVRYCGPMSHTVHAGELLREWRQRRRLSQLELACEAQVSTRHLSFIETGRAKPSREMILQLAERLQIPLRERNTLLTAGGYAHVYTERTLDDPELKAGEKAIKLVLSAHEPYPALAVDRHWTLVAANRAVGMLLAGIDPSLLTGPVNVLRLTLHPKGLAPRIMNFEQWRSHLLIRLRQQIDVTADAVLIDLLTELNSYPASGAAGSNRSSHASEYAGIAVPLQLATARGDVSLMSTTMIFGTPLDVTLSELAIECFFPVDDNSAEIMRDLCAPLHPLR
jgi:transcriptional regulator with XRE-family HTH domain